MEIKWPAYPFGKAINRRDFYGFALEGGQRIPGVFQVGLSVLRELRAKHIRTAYYPTEQEIAALGESPDWDRLRAKLLAAGHSIETIREMTPIDVAILLPASGAMTPQWDKATEARNKWLYEECCKGVAFSNIIKKLAKKPRTWGRIGTDRGIKERANAYAERHSLPLIPKRQSGTRKRKNAAE